MRELKRLVNALMGQGGGGGGGSDPTNSSKPKLEDTSCMEDEKEDTLHPYFRHFGLDPADFDPEGDGEFDDFAMADDFRGGWPYYPPTNCKRYGLNEIDKYDGGNND